MCQLCRNHLQECPFCKAPYEGTRNYAVEEIVIEMKTRVVNVLPSQPTEIESVNSHCEPRQMQPSPSFENDHTASSSPSIDFDEFSDMVIVDQR